MVLGQRERVGLLLLHLFPNGGAMDTIFVTLFCIAVGTAIVWCDGCCAMPDGHCLNILLFWHPQQPWSSGLTPVSRSHSSIPLFPLVMSSHMVLIGLLASMDVWQQKLTLINRRSSLWEKGNLFCCCKIQGFVFCSLETGDYLPERKLISQQHTDPHDDFLQQGHAFGGYLQLQFGLHIQDRLRQHWVVHTDEETTKFKDQFFF